MSKSQPNDILLLKLKNDVQFTKWIIPICLPLDSSVGGMDFTKLSLEVAGFGKTENSTASDVKQRLDLDGIDNSQCERHYQPKNVNITSKQICAGGEEGRDSCNGDSGGPLMRYGNFPNSKYPYYLLVGIVSFGPKKCGTKDAPGVYTRVSEYIDWINSNID
ncbi:serine protease easter-like [Chironomus tepperi]|uniref:serine protease easter-like n=1 Tax=Chironomus tepperi TaxID=113505 RepID=UPI00391F2137